MDIDRLPKAILTVVIAGIILLVGVVAVSGVVDDTPLNDDVETAALLDGTSWTQIDDGYGVNPKVYDSRGYAVKLQGTDNSYIQSTQEIDVTDSGNWTVSVWASRNQTITQSQSALSVDGRVIISYNGTVGNWSAWYYDESSRNSYTVSVNATSGVGELENVVVTKENTTLSINVNATRSNNISVSGSNIASAPVNSTNWDGRLEEVRLGNTAWNSSIQTTHYNNPIDPLPITETGRVMFDEPYRNTQRLFYSPGEIATNNVNFVAGLPGQELTEDGFMVSNPDYQWQNNGPRIRAESGGELDGAPVAYVDYQRNSLTNTLLTQWVSAVELVGVVILLVPAAFIVLRLRGLGESR